MQRGKGKFIVVEGGEGSGKTSCINNIQKRFPKEGFIFTREPGGTEVGEKVRAILMDKNNSGMTTLAELFLFCADRAEHCSKIIRPALRKGVSVICDRFSYSTFAYQIVGERMEKYKTIFEEFDFIARNGLKPDLIVYLDIDPVIGLGRRNQAGGITKFDAKNLAFHQRVRKGFLEQARQNRNWVIVDASSDEDVVQREVTYIIRNFLLRGRAG